MDKHDVVGIGSALLDFIVEVDEPFLEELGLEKGRMVLIDKEKSRAIFAKLKAKNIKITPGGSAANTLAGVCALGGKAVLYGKIGKDEHGETYEKQTQEHGVKTKLNKHETLTGHAITFITKDGERTFATHLGAAMELEEADIDEDEIKKSKILHIEGYQLEDPKLRAASLKAMKIAHANHVQISLDLADPGLVTRNKEFLMDIVKNFVNIVFANEHEAEAFTGKPEEEAVHAIADMCDIAIVKLGGRGSLIKSKQVLHRIPIYAVEVNNTNGAGDAYAAGILYAIAHDLGIAEAGDIAAFISSHVVSRAEARAGPEFQEQFKKRFSGQ